MNTGTEAQQSLEGADLVNGGPPKSSAPIGTCEPMSDNKHSSPSVAASPLAGRAAALIDKIAFAILGGEAGDATEMEDARACALDVLEAIGHTREDGGRLPYEAPAVRALGVMPSLELHVVESTNRPGQLSLRLYADDDTWWPVFLAMNAAGFRAGDVVRLMAVRR